MYLSYDIKGIQAVHLLCTAAYVVGASSLIAEFDELAGERSNCIFSGGGKGAFRCEDSAEAKSLRDDLVTEAHSRNLDLRIGIRETFSDACEQADILYPYSPKDLGGKPCEASGLWPVGSESKRKIHEGVFRRRQEAKDAFEAFHVRVVDEDLKKAFGRFSYSFFRTASPKEEERNDPLYAEAEAAVKALGNRNRWAVIAMDGNDMGAQFRHMKRRCDQGEILDADLES